MIINSNLKNVASILLATFLFLNTYSQEAEKIYHEDYSKLSFVFQPSRITGFYSANTNGSSYPSITFDDSGSLQFGIYFNFAQKNNFNFKTGLIAKEFNPLFTLNVNDEDIGYGTGYSLSGINPTNAFIFSIPIKAEYFYKINDKLNFVVGGGLNLNLFTGGGETTSEVFVTSETEGRKIFNAITNQEQITFSGEISFGVNYKTKFALIQLEAFYNRNLLQYPATGRYFIYDLENSADVEGDFTIDGNFYGLSLNISPKKGWLKKKSKK
jgi:hypothetical protein